MKVLVTGHSLSHIRQQNFFREVARQGCHVVYVSPDEWKDLRPRPRPERFDNGGRFEPVLLAAMGTANFNPYEFILLGLKNVIFNHRPDVIYCQQEPGSKLLGQCLKEAGDIPVVCFTWENMKHYEASPEFGRLTASEQIKACAGVVAGNDSAKSLCAPFNGNILLGPQVGVDTAHFQARPEVRRDVQVGFIGRPAPEKGAGLVKTIWPTLKILPWVDYTQLPWRMSQVQVLVCFSVDVHYWREQAMPYVACEGIACGALVVASNQGAIPFWAREYSGENPGVIIAGGPDNLTELKNYLFTLTNSLSNGDAVARETKAAAGREWVVQNLSSPVIARRLIEWLEKLSPKKG